MKDTILNELKKNKGKYISGEKLSRKIGVTRTSVWKNIKKLKEEGYIIESSTNKGYTLIESPDVLYPNEIKGLISTKLIGREIIFLEAVDSTNNYAKKMATRRSSDLKNRQMVGEGLAENGYHLRAREYG